MVILPQNLKATLEQITMKTTKNPPANVYSVTWCTISRYYSIVINVQSILGEKQFKNSVGII